MMNPMENKEHKELSEEELQRFIARVEEEGLIKAPEYMQQRVLQQLGQEQLVNRSSSGSIQFITYAMKVTVAAAAAIALLILMPMAGEGKLFGETGEFEDSRYEQQMDSYNDNSNENNSNEDTSENQKKKEKKSAYDSTNEFCSMILKKTNQLFGKEDY
ncbi:hypothetical protein [Anaerosporobacter faecicola]|uniref:hypothetical protein n=1 Tax=Anaerosporobacter faecicola TaxID=2718714 RepID=UPI0014399928|nr:hypothetical protein [Anaerosporobacter faecicola]